MVKHSGILTGTSGVYFVASQLAARDLHAAPTVGNAPNVDIMVALSDGQGVLCLQVKTTRQAIRLKGKGENKKPDHYEWDVGEKSGKINQPNLFFAFVDLKGVKSELPDVFIVPSNDIFKYFDKVYFKGDKKRRWRYHEKIENLEKYKNKWETLLNYLKYTKT